MTQISRWGEQLISIFVKMCHNKRLINQAMWWHTSASKSYSSDVWEHASLVQSPSKTISSSSKVIILVVTLYYSIWQTGTMFSAWLHVPAAWIAKGKKVAHWQIFRTKLTNFSNLFNPCQQSCHVNGWHDQNKLVELRLVNFLDMCLCVCVSVCVCLCATFYTAGYSAGWIYDYIGG